jgi:hypothetical protein
MEESNGRIRKGCNAAFSAPEFRGVRTAQNYEPSYLRRAEHKHAHDLTEIDSPRVSYICFIFGSSPI